MGRISRVVLNGCAMRQFPDERRGDCGGTLGDAGDGIRAGPNPMGAPKSDAARREMAPYRSREC
jgi:hypothetical protein